MVMIRVYEWMHAKAGDWKSTDSGAETYPPSVIGLLVVPVHFPQWQPAAYNRLWPLRSAAASVLYSLQIEHWRLLSDYT